MSAPELGVDARLLRTLRGAGIHLPSSELAAQIGASAEQVEQALGSLREAGFDFEKKPGLGWRLIGCPDRVIADDLWSRLPEGELVKEIIVFQETGSTNDVALRLGREGHAGGVAVFAERQTAGRGRFGRRWESVERAGLWFSMLVRPQWPVPEWALLTTWAGVAVARALDGFARKPVQLKWPNDVQIGGKKAAGILIESAVDSRGQMFAVVGIGVNVNQEEFPDELSDRAVSLRQVVGSAQDRAQVAAAILSELATNWPALDATALISEAASRSAILGSWIRLHSGAEIFEGMAENLDTTGRLLLRMPDGALRAMAAGEVTTRAPAADVRVL